MTAAIIALAILSQPAPIPTTYGVAECSGWPLTVGQLADDGIRVDGVHVHPGRVMVRLSRPVEWVADGTGPVVVTRRQRAHLVAHRIGSREAGWTVWSVRAPSRVAAMIAASPLCRVTATWSQVMNWPTVARDWIAARSTCYGAATWRGRAYSVWPCVWSTERVGQGSVSTLSGIGPGVMAGGSGAEAAGVETP